MNIEERIIRLLENDLNDKERDEVEKLIEDNPELKQNKVFYEQVILAIRKKGEEELRIDLDKYLKDYIESQKGGKPLSIKKYVFYGGIAASMAFAMMFYFQPKDDSMLNRPIDLQINEMPIHADSATFKKDSLQHISDSLKNN